MNEEYKKLKLIDLCARLLYGVILKVSLYDEKVDNARLTGIDEDGYLTVDFPADCAFDIEEVKPFLRSISSMTEEEKEELKTLFDAEEITSDSICYLEGGTLEEYLSHISYSFCSKIIDWLNRHHFDYRGLIEKGLALEALEGMYK